MLAQTIKISDLKQHLAIIASDSMEGRETGTVGQKKAAAYIASEFKKMGISPVSIKGSDTFLQDFELVRKNFGNISITVGGKSFENGGNILFKGHINRSVEFTNDIVFAGNGNISDYGFLKPKGKTAVIFGSNDEIPFDEKIETAKKMEVGSLLVIYGKDDEAFKYVIDFNKRYKSDGILGFKEEEIENPDEIQFLIAPSVAEHLFSRSIDELRSLAEKAHIGNPRVLRKIQGGEAKYKLDRDDLVIKTSNVLGYIKGIRNPEEVVIITCHYDHLGKSGDMVYNGADDNGSGTVALLELAEAYVTARENNIGPARSVLFVAFTGEEKGLFGSEYYVSHPVFPLDKTIADFNMDMIGRNDISHPDDSNHVYIIGSDKLSLKLHDISERNNAEHIKMNLDYTYNSDDDPNRFYYRSDHYNFAKNQVPIIFYFTGVHNDYHRPTDTYDKIIFSKLERISRLVFYTSWELANGNVKLDIK